VRAESRRQAIISAAEDQDMSGRQADIVIIGGGIVGCGVACFLAERNEGPILVVERDALGSGSTGGSFGGVRQQFSHPLEIELSRRGHRFWRTCAERFDAPCPFHEDGYLFVTGQEATAERLVQAAEVQRAAGMPEVHVLGPAEIERTVPWLSAEGLRLGTYTPRDGRVNPMDGVAALAQAARRRGVAFREGFPVAEVRARGGAWEVVGPEVVACRRVVVAAGCWSPVLLRPFGLHLDLWPKPLHGAVTGPVQLGDRVPLTIDLDTGFVVEREADGLMISVLRDRDPSDYGHAEMLAEFAELARHRAPGLQELRIVRPTVGLVDHGGDGHPYVGEVADGLWMAAGFSGHGTMHGPVIAELLARAMTGQPDPAFDLATFDPRRAPAPQAEWMQATRKG
jgi:glycine/D-amino acid oxidase-like deaminating enzyme